MRYEYAYVFAIRMSRIALISVLINDNVTLQIENCPYVLLDLCFSMCTRYY